MTNTVKPVNVGVVGAGTVGGGTIRILATNADRISERAVPVKVRRIADRRVEVAQALCDELGLDTIVSDDWNDLITDPEIDIVVELVGGKGLARTIVATALKSGKCVVTANKDLIAAYGDELFAIAAEHGTELCFEASVAGGIPIIQVLRESLVGNNFVKIAGILNGTTNYILTKMSEDGLDFATALKMAQELGYAEADPTNDVEGFDAARKVAIMASLAYGCFVSDDKVVVEGISKITAEDIAAAKELGCAIKLLGVARLAEGKLTAQVYPALLDAAHPLAAVRDSYNAVFVHGDAVEKLMLQGRGAGSLPTGSAVVGDIVSAARNIRLGCVGRVACRFDKQLSVLTADAEQGCYFVRLQGADAAVREALVAAGIAVAELRAAANGELLLLTGDMPKAALAAALTALIEKQAICGCGTLIRIEKDEN